MPWLPEVRSMGQGNKQIEDQFICSKILSGPLAGGGNTPDEDTVQGFRLWQSREDQFQVSLLVALHLSVCQPIRKRQFRHFRAGKGCMLWEAGFCRSPDVDFLLFSSQPSSSPSVPFQNVFAQLRERLHPGERHAAHDPDLPQVLWKRGWQIHTEQGRAQGDAHRRAWQLPGGKEIYSTRCTHHTYVL